MDKKVILILISMSFILNINIVNAGTVSVVQNTNYFNITGENYKVQIGKNPNCAGTETNLWIYNSNFPPFSAFSPYCTWRQVSMYNSTDWSDSVMLNNNGLNFNLIESGPTRVLINGTISNEYCASGGICLNYSVNYYFYPKNYFVKYYIWGNFTKIRAADWSFWFYGFAPFSTNSANMTYWGIVNTTGYLNKSGDIDTSPESSSSTYYLFTWNGTHNRTAGWYTTRSEIGDDYPNLKVRNYSSFNSLFVLSQAYNPTQNRTNATLSWFWMFGNSGGGDLEINETVNNLDFKPQFLDYYYPASISAISGTYQQRDNITGTYNFTVDSNGLLRFNFSTNNINHTYPVFHIKDTTSTASSYKNYIYMKNYSKVNPQWEKLNNYTDFVIQDGNSTYFGYNYILLLINKTLGSDYEFWISNSTEPIPPQYFDSSVNSTLNGTAVEFRLRWTDNVGLSGFIFSFDNGTGTFVNDSFTSFYYGNRFPLIGPSSIGKLDSSNEKSSIRFTAQASKTVDEISVYFHHYEGSPPFYLIGLQADDGNGYPSGVWFGATNQGYNNTTGSGTGWYNLTLEEPVTLTKGQVYHIVVEPDGTPDTFNYISIRRMDPLNKFVAYDSVTPEDNANTLFYDGASWSVQNYQPVYVLHYTDGAIEGFPYESTGISNLYGNEREGEEIFITGGKKIVTTVAFYLYKSGNPEDDLYISIYNVNDSTYLIQDELFASASQVGVSFSWVKHTLSSPQILENNKVYRIFLESLGTTFTNSYHLNFGKSTGGHGDATYYGTINRRTRQAADPPAAFNDAYDVVFYLILNESWSNITKVVKDTVGVTIRWRIYVNDTSNNWNVSENSLVTSLALTTMNLSSYEVWWNDPVTAYGQAFDNQGNPVPNNTNVILTISNVQCNNVTDSFGYWQCRFNAPNELGTYTVYARIGDISINTTSLIVKPKYGKTPIGTIERIVYEEPIMIQEPSGRIRIAWARIMIWRG